MPRFTLTTGLRDRTITGRSTAPKFLLLLAAEPGHLFRPDTLSATE